MSKLFTSEVERNTSKLLPNRYHGGFCNGPSISVVKSGMQKACRQFTNGGVKYLDMDCEYLSLQCFVAVAALIYNMIFAGRVSDARGLYTNMWNRLIVMSLCEDTVDINGALCLCAILKRHETAFPFDEKWTFDPVEYVRAMYKSWYCLAKTQKHRITSHIIELFNKDDMNESFRTIADELLQETYDTIDVIDAFKDGNFLNFIAAMMRYDGSHAIGGKPAEIKKAKHKWIDDLFVKKFKMKEDEAKAIKYLCDRKDEQNRMRLHTAIMLFYRQHSDNGLLIDQVKSYTDLLVFVDDKFSAAEELSDVSLTDVLQSLLKDGLDVGRVEYVYDQHTGHIIRGRDGEEMTFAEAGAKVNHKAGLPASPEVMRRFEDAYIEKNRAKKRKVPQWSTKMMQTLKSRLATNKKAGKGCEMDGMVSPAVNGSRLSDKVGKLGVPLESIRELLLVLIYRRMIGTKDTNLFNLMLLGTSRVLSVDENPMTEPIPVRDPTLSEDEDAPFAYWLQTAQNINKSVVSQLLSFARKNRSIIRDFLRSFKAIYPHFRDRLQDTFDIAQKTSLEQVHQSIYATFSVIDDEPEVPKKTTTQGEWDNLVASQVTDNGILPQCRIDFSDAVNFGFKNIAMVTAIKNGGGELIGQKVFLKVGEPPSSGPYSRASAEFRECLGLPSVPVTIVRVRITDPESFGPAADRGQEVHLGQKSRKKSRT